MTRSRTTISSLVLILVFLTGGCAMNPFQEEGVKNEEDHSDLYGGSDEMKRSHEAAKSSESAEQAIALGDAAYQQGELDKATFEYVKAIELGGKDPDILNKIADINVITEKYMNAAHAYQMSLDIDQDNQHALEGLGLIQLRNRNYELAKGNLVKALEIEPGLWQARNALGTIADLDGDQAAAEMHYRSALIIQPGFPQIHNNLGYSYYLASDWNAALKQFYRAVNYDPNFKRAWYNIGLIYTRKGRYEDALDAFRNVMKKYQAYNDMGYICMIDGNFEKADYFLQKAIDLSPSYYDKAQENLTRMERLQKSGYTGIKVPDRTITDSDTDIGTLDESGKTDLVSSGDGNDGAGGPVESGPVATVQVIERQEVSIESESDDAVVGLETDHSAVETVTVDTTDSLAVSEDVVQEAVDIQVASTGTVAVEEAKANQAVETENMTGTVAVEDAKSSQTVETENTTGTIAVDDARTSKVAEKEGTKASEEGNASGNSELPTDSDKPKASDEKAEYQRALEILKEGRYEEAASAFSVFLVEYPDSSYADNASYWIGETYYVNRDFENALEAFNRLVENYPDSAKLPDTRLKIGYVHYEKHDWTAARQELTGLVTNHPDTRAAELASDRLQRMDNEGH